LPWLASAASFGIDLASSDVHRGRAQLVEQADRRLASVAHDVT
jgi:hypothetical protein